MSVGSLVFGLDTYKRGAFCFLQKTVGVGNANLLELEV